LLFCPQSRVIGHAPTSKSQVTVPNAVRQQLCAEMGKEINYVMLPRGTVAAYPVRVWHRPESNSMNDAALAFKKRG
jgi:hypothetical protein